MKLKTCLAIGGAMALLISEVSVAQVNMGSPSQPIEAQLVTASKIKGKTNVERAIGKCFASVLGGALLGALIGKAAGDSGKGALVGAAAGGVACAIMLKVAKDKDKEQIRQAQLLALNNNQFTRTQWTTEEGEVAVASVMPTGSGSVVVADKGSIFCRTDDVCKVGDNWYPKENILNGTIDPNAPRAVRVAVQGAQSLRCRRTSTSVKVGDQSLPDGSDVACLLGDVWVTGDELKKNKIRETDIAL